MGRIWTWCVGGKHPPSPTKNPHLQEGCITNLRKYGTVTHTLTMVRCVCVGLWCRQGVVSDCWPTQSLYTKGKCLHRLHVTVCWCVRACVCVDLIISYKSILTQTVIDTQNVKGEKLNTSHVAVHYEQGIFLSVLYAFISLWDFKLFNVLQPCNRRKKNGSSSVTQTLWVCVCSLSVQDGKTLRQLPEFHVCCNWVLCIIVYNNH